MSRRHIQPSGSEPLPPFSENLIFWAPLAEGDLTDHISGASLTLTGQGTISYDSSVSAYKFKLTSSTAQRAVGYWDIDLTDKMNLNSSQEYTIFARVMANGKVSGNYPYLVGLGNFNSSGSYKPHINTDTANCVGNSLINSAFIRHSNNMLYFIAANRSETNSSSHASNPANWNNSNLCAKRVCVHFRRNNVDDGSNTLYSYIKDIMIFNRALTAQEVAQI